MKKIDFKDKKTIRLVVGILVVILAAIFFYKGLQGKPLNLWDNSNKEKLVDIANSKDYSKYEGKVTASFEGEQVLDFSVLHKNEIKVVQGTGAQARWFKLLNTENENYVTLYFTYEGGRGYTVDDYIENVLKTDADIKVEDVKFAGQTSETAKHVLNVKENVEYYLLAVKKEGGDPWLAIVENKKADDKNFAQDARDLIRSLEIK